MLEYGAISITALEIMNFQIRLSKPEDSEKILELQASSLKILSSSYTPTQIKSLIRSQALVRFEGEIGVVAEYQNNIVGFAALLIQSSQIAGVYVHPDFIRQGIGTQLLETIEKIAIDKGSKATHVISSLDSVNFYQAAGYKIIRESGFYSEEEIWVPCVNLEKQLISISRTKRIYRYILFLVSKLRPIFSFISFIVIAALMAALLPLIISLIVSLLR